MIYINVFPLILLVVFVLFAWVVWTEIKRHRISQDTMHIGRLMKTIGEKNAYLKVRAEQVKKLTDDRAKMAEELKRIKGS